MQRMGASSIGGSDHSVLHEEKGYTHKTLCSQWQVTTCLFFKAENQHKELLKHRAT